MIMHFNTIDRSCYLFILLIVIVRAQEGPVIKIPNGQVQANIQKSYDGRDFMAFEGIPYAKPPIGALRFKEAEPAEPWDNILLANTPYTCIQMPPLEWMKSTIGVENCLYINVFVPGVTIKSDANLDVIVHIHGGAFILGSPKLMAGPKYIMDRDVIYVTMNYRIGIFGFLSTQDEVVPGNNGLKDQVLALKWIQSNIKYFGGNENSITLTGLSAGSASVHYHYLSPRSKGLFHRGIMQSGTVLNTWSIVEKPVEKAKKLGAIFNCSQESNTIMVDCLRKVSATILALSIRQFVNFMSLTPYDPFGPVIENGGANPFIAEHPYKLLKEGKLVNDVPTIMSTAKDEGIFPVGMFVKLNKMEEINIRWNEIMPYALDMQDTVEESKYVEVVQKIRKHYYKEEAISNDNILTSIKLFSDRLFYLDFQKATKLHVKASKSPVYYYFFSYVSPQPSFFKEVLGAAHSYDTKMLFNLQISPAELTSGDKKMVDFFTGLVSEFGKTGVANVANTKWEPINKETDEINYLHILSGEDYKMEKTKEFAPSAFWDELPIQENDKLF